MRKTVVTVLFPVLVLAVTMLAGCGASHPTGVADPTEPLQAARIVGSAESPDPVLQRVRELEKAGVVSDVVVMESFPVQIELRAPQRVIDELDRIPRKGGIR